MKSHIIQAVLALMLVAGVACAEAQSVTIEGTTRDAQLGSPLADVAVYLIGTPAVAITKTTGRFVFNDVKAGTYPIKAVYKGYTSISDTLVVRGDASIKKDFALHAQTPQSQAPQSQAIAVEPAAPAPASRQRVNDQTSPGNQLLELKTVCDCFDFALGKLNKALELREQYATHAAFKTDQSAVAQMDELLDMWQLAQQHCLLRFGTKLFEKSSCNRPEEVSKKRIKLSSLGIKN